MTKPCRVYFHLAGDQTKASSRVRGWWIAEELRSLGHECEVRYVRGKRDYVSAIGHILNSRVTLFQKTYSRYDILLLRLALLFGRQVLFDIDDAPSRTKKSSAQDRAATMMRRATYVLAGSRRLVELAETAGARPVLIPSGIRMANYPKRPEPPTDASTLCLGWIGNGAHYSDDLISILEPVLARLSETVNFRLKIVGACNDDALHAVFDGSRGYACDLIDGIDWSDPDAVTRETESFDIGLYPLNESDFNEFKCGFKALEYMARGIPVVASRVSGNEDIVTDGENGYLVEGMEAWLDRLARLASDRSERERMGHNGREAIFKHFATQRIAERISALVSGQDESAR